jgi:hypothetical protein
MHYIGRLLVLLADQHVISAFWWRLAGVGHHSPMLQLKRSPVLMISSKQKRKVFLLPAVLISA